jgi:hypothetical protein
MTPEGSISKNRQDYIKLKICTAKEKQNEKAPYGIVGNISRPYISDNSKINPNNLIKNGQGMEMYLSGRVLA